MAEGCIRFDIGQPDFKTPQNIKDAAKKAVDDNILTYAPTKGIPELRQEIARYESTKGRKFEEENIIVTDGGMGALTFYFLAMKPKSEILIMRPYFPPYIAMMAISRCKPIISDFEDIEKNINENTATIILNSPRNPDGKVFSKEESKHVAELAGKYDIPIVSDEVYDRMVYDSDHFSISTIYDNTFIINSVSKSYAMTGFRVGWITGPTEEVNQFAKIGGTLNASVCSISQMAALEALKGSQESVEEMKREYRSRRDLITKRMDEMGWEYTAPGGSFYVFPKINKDSWKTAFKLIKEAKVSTVPGKAFGCEGHLRLCYGSVDKEAINEGFDRIKRVLG